MVASKDNLSHTIIREIAGHLDCGNDCYFNPKTTELIFIPHNLHDHYSESDGFWEKELEKINEDSMSYIKFEIPTSFESFQIMERFLEEIDDTILKDRLIIALSEKKPFRNFKYIIDSSNYRNKWFAFKEKELEEMVRKQFAQQKRANNNGSNNS